MERPVIFANSRGITLKGILSDDDFTRFIVVFAHGLGSDKDSQKYIDFQKLLKQKGVSVFRFDFFGHGESKGNFEDVTITEGVDDILQAINFLKEKGFTKIGLVGTSFGGICSIMAASKTKELQFLGLLAPVSSPETMPDLVHHEAANKLKTSLNTDTVNNGHKVAHKITIPVFIIHGNKDEIVPLEQSIQISKLLSNSRLEIIEGADHQMRDPYIYYKVLNSMVEFITNNVFT